MKTYASLNSIWDDKENLEKIRYFTLVYHQNPNGIGNSSLRIVR